ncbi:MAG: TIGR02444 family protein [Myxococcota bacterium]
MTEPAPGAFVSAPTLWAFAGRTYGREGVAPVCLRLQDEHDLDVDVLLAGLWIASYGQPVDEDRLSAILDAAAPAQARVTQIRALRRALGAEREGEPAWKATYEHLKAAELAAERVELERIEATVTPWLVASEGEPIALAREGLRRYACRQDARSCDALLDRLIDHAQTR